MTRELRLRRSELSTPGTSEKMMVKAAESEADLVFLDLEDAVAPSQKEAARAPVVAALTGLDWGRKTRAVRVNGVGTPWCLRDVTEIVRGAAGHLDLVILPKVRRPDDVRFVDTLLTQLEWELGLAEQSIGLEVLIEEAEALVRVEEIAACSPRLEALILGVGDLSASQGMRVGHVGSAATYPGDIWHYARTRMTLAARAHGLDAIDGPFADYRDGGGYRQEAQWAAAIGAVGKWAIHPDQIAIANEVFAPTDEEIRQASRSVDAVRTAEESGAGAATMDGVMIDAATARIAEVVLERAARINGA